MKSTYTRDVSPEMMKELKEGGFAPFVEFTRTSEDLALCFRGNDSEKGKVSIYRHNHMIWELCYGSNGSPRVVINPDHARFMKDWRTCVVKKLMEMGFTASKGRSYEQLDREKGFVTRHRQKDGKYEYHAVKLEYYPSDDRKKTEAVVAASYALLVEMQESYFSRDDEKARPWNYIKQYYFDNHTDADEDKDKSFDGTYQPCVEKHVQQELFLNNHFLKDGLFIYDLEFAQPRREGVTVGNRNKPDMLGLRFDQTGKMVAICLIEVKSTKSALNAKMSGIRNHLNGMEEYLRITTNAGPLMDDRRREACRILNQYRELGFYGVTEHYSEEDFIKLRPEIIFIFSHEIWEYELDGSLYRSLIFEGEEKESSSVYDVLQGYHPYGKVRSGEYTGKIIVAKKAYI